MALPRRKKGASKIQRATPEERLLDYAKGLKKFRKGRRAVLIRMSELSRLYSDRRYAISAKQSFAPLLREFEGIILELGNGDIICAINGASYAAIDNVVLKLRMMFRDDENLKRHEDDDEDIFVRWWDMTKDFKDFATFAKEHYNRAQQEKMEKEAIADGKASIGDKIFALTQDNDDLSASDALKSRFANLGNKEKNKEPEEKSDLASRFGKISAKTGLEGLSDRLKGKDKKEEIEEEAEQKTEEAPQKAKTANQPAPQEKGKEVPLATEFTYHNQKEAEDERPPGIKRDIRYVEIDPDAKEAGKVRPVSATDLEKIETAILATDLSTMVTREDIRLISGSQKATTVFSDRMVPIAKVREKFLPLVDISSDRWFMRHLREIVDRRTLIAALDFSDPSAIARGFRVSIDMIDSKEFTTFERNTKKIRRNQLILEFSFQDIVSKVSDYLRVQDILQARGYQICIGDMDPYMFTLLNRSVIRSDFEKVRWTKEFETEATQEWKDVFKEMVQTVGRERVILVACQDAEALEAGQKLGIKLYHGSYINTL